MYEITKKQKIIVAIILFMVIICIIYYFYTKDNIAFSADEEIFIENNVEEKIEETEEVNQTSNKIIIHISGAVNKEGIVELEENSRIADAVEKAGGLKENADINKINLAFKLEDGMKVYIPSIEERKNEININNQIDEEQTSKYITSASELNEDTNQNTDKVNINTANQTELETLPGIGPATALKIINYRKEKGKFKSIEDIKEVSGIGDTKYEKIKDLICV